MTVQIRNPELLDILRSDVQMRNEPNYAWRTLAAAHLAIPGLRGLWMFNSFDEFGNVHDLTGQGHTMAYNGNPQFRQEDLSTFCRFDGAGDYFNHPTEDYFHISGTESFIYTPWQGLTLGCWCYFHNFTVTHSLITKWASSNKEYWLGFDQASFNNVVFMVSDDGAGQDVVQSSWTETADEWVYIVGRYDPSTEIKVWVDRLTNTNAAGIAASIFDGTAPFNIGAYNNGSGPHDGRIVVAWLSAMYLSDSVVECLFEQTRAMFGK